MTYFSVRMATSSLGDAVEMKIDDEMGKDDVNAMDICRGRTIAFKYMNGQIEICISPHTEITRFGLDRSEKLFNGGEHRVGKIHSRMSANDSDRDAICFIENTSKPDEFILFSYKAGEVVVMKHSESGSEHELFKHQNVFEIDLIDKNATPHGCDTPKKCL